MVNAAREPLRGKVELDETWVGGTQAGLRGSRQLKGRKAALVLVAVERRGRASGRVRMEVIPDFAGATIRRFVARNIAVGATVYTDGLKSFDGLPASGYKHVPAVAADAAPVATGRQIRRPACRPRHRQPEAVADRYPPRVSAATSSRSTSISSSFGTIGGRPPWPASRRSSAWAPRGRPHPPVACGVPRTFSDWSMTADPNIWGYAETIG